MKFVLYGNRDEIATSLVDISIYRLYLFHFLALSHDTLLKLMRFRCDLIFCKRRGDAKFANRFFLNFDLFIFPSANHIFSIFRLDAKLTCIRLSLLYIDNLKKFFYLKIIKIIKKRFLYIFQFLRNLKIKIFVLLD